jgi:hypothetical protein
MRNNLAIPKEQVKGCLPDSNRSHEKENEVSGMEDFVKHLTNTSHKGKNQSV